MINNVKVNSLQMCATYWITITKVFDKYDE